MTATKPTDLTQEFGIKNAEVVFGKEVAQQLAQFWSTDVDADFAKEICNYAYGFMYSRKILDPKHRELCSCMALTVLRMQPELAVHIKAALNCGATKQEIVEVLIQAHLYAGVPVTMEALTTYRAVIKEIEQE